MLVVIAGHNGAGKSTCYKEYLRDDLDGYLSYHIDPDAIEREIRTEWPGPQLTDDEFSLRAAQEATRRRLNYVKDGVSFSLETVLSDPFGDKLGFMTEAVACGYFVVLLAVGLDSADKSQERVLRRVALGGHNVKPEKIQERYPRVLRNFARAVGLVSAALVVDNSEDAIEDQIGSYFAFAHFDDGKLVADAPLIPRWWSENYPPSP